MPIEMGVWRIDGSRPLRLPASSLPSERMLEDFLAEDPTLLGEPLLVIGRQVRTSYGKLIDLLAMDAEGNLHVLELKRDRTPREVVAQLLDYVLDLANAHLGQVPFEAAFEDVFGQAPPARSTPSNGSRSCQ